MEAPIVTILVLLLVHVPPVDASDNVADVPMHRKVDPVIGCIGFTVTIIVALHPVVPAIYVIVAVPPATPVIIPVVVPAVAIAALLLLHTPDPAGFTRVITEPAHTGVFPVIAPGKLLTVTVVVVIQPEAVI